MSVYILNQVMNTFLEIRQTECGRGLFALCDIPVDTVVEKSPLISFDTFPHSLRDYIFSRQHSRGTQHCLCLGLGSLFNHSDDYNVDTKYIKNDKKFDNCDNPGVMLFTTKKPVAAGEQLFISYGAGWFDSRMH